MQITRRADVRPGDMATHRRGNLDARPVESVDLKAGTIRLRIGTVTTAPLPMSNYRFSRPAR